MSTRAVLAPLISGSTYRRAVFLLLGGVLLLPYLMLATIFASMLRDAVAPRPLVLGLLAVAAVIAVVPLFLAGSRALEVAAARALLDVDLPDPAPARRLDRETRLRSALWISLHMVAGGMVMFALISAFPMALVFIATRLGMGSLPEMRFGPIDQNDRGWLALAGLLTLIVLAYAVAGLGALARLMAPALLGPSPTERIAALEARAGQLAERNRLARELHDSVGHALTVATLQAGAARGLLDTDPQFVRRALRAIEDTSRAAADDLDHVLGLLRDREGEHADRTVGTRAPQRTLSDLDQLLADTRASGQPVTADVSGAVDGLPAAVSREGYRIVQEGLTNAVRYGRGQPVALRVDVPVGGLDIELVNPVPEAVAGPAGPGAAGRRGGRGLAGVRERALLLGGRMTAGAENGTWRLSVHLPTEHGDSDRRAERHSGAPRRPERGEER